MEKEINNTQSLPLEFNTLDETIWETIVNNKALTNSLEMLIRLDIRSSMSFSRNLKQMKTQNYEIVNNY